MKFVTELSDPLKERMERFRASISNQKHAYVKLSGKVRKQFAEVIKEETTECIYCGISFVGKSIGPHYKNSPACAAYKRDKKNEGMNEEPRRPLTTLEPNTQRTQPITSYVKEQAQKQNNYIYDEVNEYFV